MDRMMNYGFISLGSNPNKLWMNLTILNFFQILNNGFLKRKTKICINYSQLTLKLLRQLQKDGFIRYFDVSRFQGRYIIKIYLSDFSKISSFKVLSKVQKRLQNQKIKTKGNLNFSCLYFSNSSFLLENFGESLVTFR